MAKYDYCKYGHPRLAGLAECPVCQPGGVTGTTQLVTANAEPVTDKRKPRSDKVHADNAARQRAYRERGK